MGWWRYICVLDAATHVPLQAATRGRWLPTPATKMYCQNILFCFHNVEDSC